VWTVECSKNNGVQLVSLIITKKTATCFSQQYAMKVLRIVNS